jgi:ribosomal protein L7Ae-like RNA K-turn-binding protein
MTTPNQIKANQKNSLKQGKNKTVEPVELDSAGFPVWVGNVISKHEDPEVADRLKHYSKLIPMPQDVADIKTFEQIRAEIIKTQASNLNLLEQKGKMVDQEEVKKVLRQMRDAFADELLQIPNKIVKDLHDLDVVDRSRILDIGTKTCKEALENAKKKLGKK